jgi:hypothetical protein
VTLNGGVLATSEYVTVTASTSVILPTGTDAQILGSCSK